MAHVKIVTVVGAAFVCIAAALTSGCEVSAYPDNAYGDDDYPPADFLATTEPVYFEGHAAYWYHNRWFYRNGGHWGHYDHEPAGLAARRGQFGGGARRNYGRPSTRGGSRRGGRGGRR